MIELKQVAYRYRSAATSFHFPDWTVGQGQHCLMLGNSGSGKTTLLHIMAGILKPQRGEVRVGKANIAQLQGTALDHYRGQHIGLVFQKPHLVQSLTLQENLFLAQYLAGLRQDKHRVQEVMQSLNILQRKNARVATLSQGEAQRAAIARAVLNKPLVILADEPTSSLDDDNCRRVLHILQEQADKYHATLLIATHDQRVKEEIKHHITLSDL